MPSGLRRNLDRIQKPVWLRQLADMVERDRRSTRSDSPLKIAKDAVVIDSTGLSIQKFRTDDGRSA